MYGISATNTFGKRSANGNCRLPKITNAKWDSSMGLVYSFIIGWHLIDHPFNRCNKLFQLLSKNELLYRPILDVLLLKNIFLLLTILYKFIKHFKSVSHHYAAHNMHLPGRIVLSSKRQQILQI